MANSVFQRCIQRIILPVLSVVLFSGCQTPSPVSDQPATHTLIQRARPADVLGVELEKQQDGYRIRIPRDPNSAVPQSDVIPFESRLLSRTSLPIISVRLNGHLVSAYIDTGAAGSLIDYHEAIRSGIFTIENPDRTPGAYPILRGKAYGFGGSAERYPGIITRMEAGTVQLGRVPVSILDKQHAMFRQGWLKQNRVGMLIGQDILRQFSQVTFRFKEREVALRTASLTPSVFKHPFISLPLSKGGPMAVIEALLPGHGDVMLALDTGADAGLIIPFHLADELNFREHHLLDRILQVQGIAGTTSIQDAGSRTLKLSPGISIKLPVYIDLIRDKMGKRPFALLGLKGLKKFNVTLDYIAGRVYLEQTKKRRF